MTSRDLCYWLQGFFELDNTPVKTGLTIQQTESIRRHLALVFEHEIDPSMPNPKLDAIHNKVTLGGPAKNPLMRC